MVSTNYATWTQFLGTQDAPTGTAFVSAEIVASGVNNGANVYIDDVSLTQPSGTVALTGGALTAVEASSTANAIKTKVSGDAQNRFTIDASGMHSWGDGTTTPGTTLSRNSTGGMIFNSDIGVDDLLLLNFTIDSHTPQVAALSSGGTGGSGLQAGVYLNDDTSTQFSTILLDSEVAELTGDVTIDGDLAVDGRITGISNYSVPSTGALTLSTSYQDVPGATKTFTTAKANTVAVVAINADASWGGSITIGDTIIVTIAVDGTDDNSKSAIVVGTGSSFNGAAFGAGCTYAVTLASAGSHTIKMRAKRTASGAGSGSANINVHNARGATIPGGTTLTLTVYDI